MMMRYNANINGKILCHQKKPQKLNQVKSDMQNSKIAIDLLY
jgi:hypothetical protein